MRLKFYSFTFFNRYKELQKNGKLHNLIEKRRKKNSNKNHRWLGPTRRGGIKMLFFAVILLVLLVLLLVLIGLCLGNCGVVCKHIFSMQQQIIPSTSKLHNCVRDPLIQYTELFQRPKLVCKDVIICLLVAN